MSMPPPPGDNQRPYPGQGYPSPGGPGPGGPYPPYNTPIQNFPGYQQQPYGAPPLSTKTDGMCIASFVLGIIGLVLFCIPVPAVLAVIFGSIGRGRTQRNGTNGRGLAVTGIILGIITIVASIAFWVWAAKHVHCYDDNGTRRCTSDQ